MQQESKSLIEGSDSVETDEPWSPAIGNTTVNEDRTSLSVQGGGRAGGLAVFTAMVFLVGEMAGSGVLALPDAIVNAGWIGLVLILVCSLASGYSGVLLGQCWIILQERWPEYQGHFRYPYPAIGERAIGKWMRYVISFCIAFTLFGVATVFLLLASQNVQSLIKNLNWDFSFCFWLLIMAAILAPCTWLGTPNDFWPAAVGAFTTTAIACLLLFIAILVDSSDRKDVIHTDRGFSKFFLAFGTILFAFGGASIFPTVQNDMREPKKFPRSVLLAYSILLAMYVPVAAAGYFTYGDDTKTNILNSLPRGPLRYIIEILITIHLLFGFIIVVNPFSQDFEESLKIPKSFCWQRCVFRTVVVASILFVGETVPQFGPILSLIGGSTVTFLTFVAPGLFYLALCRQEGEWPKRVVPLYQWAINIEIMTIGVVGGIASTISAINVIAAPDTFKPPCYVNLTAASIQN